MKKILILLFTVIFSESLMAQCQFISERDYEAAKYRLSSNRGNINTFQSAMEMNRAYCLSSRQAKEIANFLANDRDKFDFLVSSFPTISDKENFADVMDVFRLFSSAIRLYHQTLGKAIHQTHIQQPLSTNPNCPRAADLASFNNLKNQVTASANDRQMASAIINAANQCFTTQQIVSVVSIIQDENIRFDVLKRLQPAVFDVENYGQAANILSPNFRNQFLTFLQNPNITAGNPIDNQEPRAIAEIDFTNFLNSVRKQSFEKDKESQIKTYMKNAYLKSDQIKLLLKLLSFDATKLELAKFLFDRCIDRQNYFQVVDALQFSSSKAELNEYISSRK